MNVKREGRVEEITSPANPRIKAIKALALKKNRDREGLFLAEGTKLATDALAAGWTIRTLVQARDADNSSLAAKVRTLGGDILLVPHKLLTAITRRDNPQAIVAVIEQRPLPALAVPEGNVVWLSLDRVRDPGNLGTCFRTAEALGVEAIVLVGDTTDPYALETVRATMGAFFHVPFHRMDETTFVALAQQWKEKGAVIGTHLEGAIDHRTIDYGTGPQLILMGNEQAGLTAPLATVCSQLARISMSGTADSLNLAVATGIMLFESRRHAL